MKYAALIGAKLAANSNVEDQHYKWHDGIREIIEI